MTYPMKETHILYVQQDFFFLLIHHGRKFLFQLM